MADTIYDVEIVDPTTKKVMRRATFRAPSALPPERLDKIKTHNADKLGLDPAQINILPLSEQSAFRLPRQSVAAPPRSVAVPPLARSLAEAAPFLALNLIPGGQVAQAAGGMGRLGAFLASHPGLVDAVLQSLGAGAIAGTEAGLRGKEIGPAATTGAAIQGVLQGLVRGAGPIMKRLGGAAMRTLEDATAERIVSAAKKLVPWFAPLSPGHQGIAELAQTGEGTGLLRQHFGKALKSVQDQIPEDAMTTISSDDAAALGLVPERLFSAASPQGHERLETSLARVSPAGNAILASVPTRQLVQSVLGVGKTNPALSTRIMTTLDDTLPETAGKEFNEARRLYREGINLVKGLQSVRALDPQSGRLNVERLGIGLRTRFGEPGKPGVSIVEQTKAPGAFELLKSLSPAAVKAPHAVGLRSPFLTSFGHIGAGLEETPTAQSVLTRMQPRSILFSAGIPLTGAEKESLRRIPAKAQAAGKALGVFP